MPVKQSSGVTKAKLRTAMSTHQRIRKISGLSIGSFSVYRSSIKSSSTTKLCEVEKRPERKHSVDLHDIDPRVIYLFQHLPEAPKVEMPEIPRPRLNREYTLVLDVDETMIHCSDDPSLPYAFDIDVITDPIHGLSKKYYVRKRPHLDYFLQQVAERFEVITFTAGYKTYANRILDHLDPNRSVFSHRLFRDACYIKDRKYIKNLNALGRDLDKTILVDNSLEAFGFQLDNGLLIDTWTSDPADEGLLLVLEVLGNIHKSKANVPHFFKNIYGLSRFIEHKIDLNNQCH